MSGLFDNLYQEKKRSTLIALLRVVPLSEWSISSNIQQKKWHSKDLLQDMTMSKFGVISIYYFYLLSFYPRCKFENYKSTIIHVLYKGLMFLYNLNVLNPRLKNINTPGIPNVFCLGLDGINYYPNFSLG